MTGFLIIIAAVTFVAIGGLWIALVHFERRLDASEFREQWRERRP